MYYLLILRITTDVWNCTGLEPVFCSARLPPACCCSENATLIIGRSDLENCEQTKEQLTNVTEFVSRSDAPLEAIVLERQA